jgi:molecular chaperone DnaK
MRSTIDYGIDLGTTNSAIARQRGLETEVISGDEGLLVPSVVHASPDGTFQVGQVAVEFQATDPANVTAEFKRLMGTSETINLPALGRSLSPAELSAKVLQYLIRRAERAVREGPIQAAVITIPAMSSFRTVRRLRKRPVWPVCFTHLCCKSLSRLRSPVPATRNCGKATG